MGIRTRGEWIMEGWRQGRKRGGCSSNRWDKMKERVDFIFSESKKISGG